jgi:hypothetical protein
MPADLAPAKSGTEGVALNLNAPLRSIIPVTVSMKQNYPFRTFITVVKK